MKNTLLITLTRKCQLDCKYCSMDRDKPDIPEGHLYKAVDLVHTGFDPKIQFFGGEPLLRFNLLRKAVSYSESRYPKRCSYSVTTNGLIMNDEMLDLFKEHDVEVMFSLDGGTAELNSRRGMGGRFGEVLSNLRKCQKKGIRHFINMIVTPGCADNMQAMYDSLVSEGIRFIKVGYVLGEYWNSCSMDTYLENLEKIRRRSKEDGVRLYDSFRDEPVFAVPVKIVDTDGGIYSGCSIVLEKSFPGLHKAFYLGHIHDFNDITEIAGSYESQILKIVRSSMGEKDKGVILNNIMMGLMIRKPGQACPSLELHLTSRCNLDCCYCDLDRSLPDMNPGLVEKSLQLFLRGKAERKTVQFFGGEPVLRFDLVKVGLEELHGHEVKPYIAINGLILDDEMCDTMDRLDFNVILSVDGDRRTQLENRPGHNGEPYQFERLLKSAEMLRKHGVNFSVNMVVRPSNVKDMFANYSYVRSMGPRRIKVSYCIGDTWDESSMEKYCTGIKRILSEAEGCVDFNSGKPALAADSTVVDGRGDVYRGCTLSAVKKLPSLKQINHAGNIEDIRSFDEVYHDRTYQFYILATSAYKSDTEAYTVMNNLDMGLRVGSMVLDEKTFRNVRMVPQKKKISSLMLMITYSCQMECTYCNVKQGPVDVPEEIIVKAIGLLMTSEEKEVQLRLWGGEPLLKPEIVRYAIEQGDRKSRQAGKRIRYMITTNCLDIKEVKDLLLREDVELMISLDGGIETNRGYRPIKGSQTHEVLIENYKWVVENGVRHFISMTVTPANAKDLLKNLESLKALGALRVQVCFASGMYWDKDSLFSLLESLEEAKAYCESNDIELMNLSNQAEPSMLSDELIVDTDGRIFYDIAIFHEKRWPWLRDEVYLGSVSDTGNLQKLYHAKGDISVMITGDGRSQLMKNNILVGMVIREFIGNRLNPPKRQTETNRFFRFLNYTPNEQHAFNMRHGLGLESYILHISNRCRNECIFCRNKEAFTTSTEYIDYRMRKPGPYSKVSLVGNEPLNHPEIKEIVKSCRDKGFKEIGLMTSGMFLKEKAFVEQLYRSGLRSVSMPIYSTDSEVHDSIVGREGDHRDVMRALENLKKKHIRIYLHTNLLLQNIDGMARLEGFANDIAECFLILPVRKKESNLAYREVVPSFSRMIEGLKGTGVNSLAGFPLCIAKQIQKRLKLPEECFSDAMKVYLLDQRFMKISKCQDCTKKRACPGIFREMLEISGDDDICPI